MRKYLGSLLLYLSLTTCIHHFAIGRAAKVSDKTDSSFVLAVYGEFPLGAINRGRNSKAIERALVE